MLVSSQPAALSRSRLRSAPALRRNSWRKLAVSFTASVGIAAAGYWVYQYHTVGRYMVSAQDAYVMSDFVRVAAPFGGTLTEKFAAGDTHVQKNEIVATIDGKPVMSNVAGTVRHVFASVGDSLSTGAPLVSVAPDGKAYVVAGFSVSRLKSVRSGQPVSIRVDGFPQFRIHGVVAPLAEDARGTVSTVRGSSHPSTAPRTAIRVLTRSGPRRT